MNGILLRPRQRSHPDTGDSTHSYSRDAFRCHISAVETRSIAGITPPREWTAVRDSYTRFIELGDHAADRLARAVIGGQADLTQLRAAAVTEALATSEADATVNTKVQQRVYDQLHSLYAPQAAKNYRLACDRYDAAAKAFTAAATRMDPEAGSDALVHARAAQREAWLAAPTLAAALDDARNVLFAAAALNGARGDVAFGNVATDQATTELQISLACEPGNAHRRKVWAAWNKKEGRTGRWGALAALRVKLRASSTPTPPPHCFPVDPISVANPAGKIEVWDLYDGDVPAGWYPVTV